MISNLKEKINIRLVGRFMKVIAIGLFSGYMLSALIKINHQLDQFEDTFKVDMKQMYTLFSENQHSIEVLNEVTQNLADRSKTTVQSLSQIKTLQEILNELVHQQMIPLDEKLKALTQPSEAHSDKPVVASMHFSQAPGYRIYGVQPYGIVVINPEGKFMIAKIGQPLGNLGIVQMITSHKIIAGGSIITDEP